MTERFHNFIAGEWSPPESGETIENVNPARTSDVIGLFPDTAPSELDRAVASAQRGFERWSRVPAPERGLVLKRAGDLLAEHKEEFARIMTREMGKVLEETRGDVQEAIDTAYYAAMEGRRLFGHTVPSELRDKWAMSYRRPIGVFGIITPFNFPLAVPSWKIFPALLCGNSVIYKPSEDVPHAAHRFVEVLLEAGLPSDVIQLLHGRGETIGKAIVEHPGVPGLSFTGSTETGSFIGETAGRMHK
ncbi:MAG: aldehyde dehydrogenase family protein, partial [Gemmatimonadota bacterium]|nr:aldehyde dehydrogenase family protein [Gemmatimonadota bacterium]